MSNPWAVTPEAAHAREEAARADFLRRVERCIHPDMPHAVIVAKVLALSSPLEQALFLPSLRRWSHVG